MRRGARACDRSDLSQSFRLPFSFPPPRPGPLSLSRFLAFSAFISARCLAAYLPRARTCPFRSWSPTTTLRDSAAVASEPGPLPSSYGFAWRRSEAELACTRRGRRASCAAAAVTTGLVLDGCLAMSPCRCGLRRRVCRSSGHPRRAGRPWCRITGAGRVRHIRCARAHFRFRRGKKKRAAAGTESRGVDFFLSSFYAFRVPFKFSS